LISSLKKIQKVTINFYHITFLQICPYINLVALRSNETKRISSKFESDTFKFLFVF